MKLNGLGPRGIGGAGGEEPVKGPRQQGAKGTGFSELLRESLTAQGPGGAAPVAPPPPLGGVTPLQRTMSPEQARAAAVSGDALELLDHLSGLLSTPDLSPSALDQVADALEEKAAELISARDALPKGDPLRRQANEAGVLSAVEAYKIRRGDYW